MRIGNWLVRLGQSSDQYVQLPQEMMHQLESRLMLSAAPVFAPMLGAPADTWTVMVYMDGDNNLEEAGIGDVNQMEVVGSTSAVNVLVEFDRAVGYDSSNGNWTDTRRGRVSKDNNPDLLSTQFTSIGEQNMGDPQTLTDFITWSTTTYPAEHYMLVMWDHGGGISGVCLDDSSGGDILSVPEVGQGITDAGMPMDIVGFDACLMAMMEQAYEIRDWSDYMVASEDTIPVDGWSYDTILADLVADPAQSPLTLASDVVTRYSESYNNAWTLSAVDLNAVSGPAGLAAAMDQFASTILSDATMDDYGAMQACWQSDPFFMLQEFRDLGQFLTDVAGGAITASITAAAQTALDAYNAAVVANESDPGKGGTGMSIYLQSPNSSIDGAYLEAGLAFTIDTQWDEFLDWWGTGPPPGSIIGQVWNDLNQDCLPDADEPGLVGHKVYLDLNGNGTLEPQTTVTKYSVDVPALVLDYATIQSGLDIAGMGGVVLDVNVKLSIQHTFDADLDVTLVSPSGVRVPLFARVGYWEADFIDTVLDDQADTPIDYGLAPFTGTFQPQGSLADFAGEDPNGQWLLEVADMALFDEGELVSWSLTLTSGEPEGVTDADGNYAFTGLPAGDYTIRQIKDSGWVCTFPTDPDVGFHSVTLGMGEVLENVDFGDRDARPVAQKQSVAFVTNIAAPTAIILVGSDESTPADELIYQIVDQPRHGTAILMSNMVIYTPDADWVGLDMTDRFRFVVIDTGNPDGSGTNVGSSDPVFVTIVMNPENDTATVSPLTGITDEDTALTLTLLGADEETAPADMTYVVTRPAEHGTVTIVGDQATYTPDANYSGEDSFEYAATDDGDPVGTHGYPGDLTSGSAIVSVTINPVNDVPTALDQAVATDEDQPLTITLTGSDVETAGADLVFRIISPPEHGTVVLTGQQVLYTPDSNYHGPDSFQFTTTDTGDPAGTGARATSTAGTISITVNAVNDLPIANGRLATVNQDTAMTIVLGASDVETPVDLLVYAITQPTHGTAVLSMVDGVTQVLYTPAAGYSGTDSLTFTVTDTGDPAGSGASVMTSLAGTVSIGVARRQVLDSGRKLTFPDGDNVITLSLSAGSGVFYNLAPFDYADPRTITDIILQGTNEKTSLVITSKRAIGIGNITVQGANSMGSIVAKTSNLLGDIEILGGSLNVIQMNDVSGGRHIHLGAPQVVGKNGLAASFNRVEDLSIFSQTPIKSLTAAEWVDGDGSADVVQAPWIGAMRVAGNKKTGASGNFQADLTLSGAGSPGLTLAKMDVAGGVSGSAWDITGNVGAVSVVGEVDQWTLQLHSNIKSIKLGKVLDGDVTVDNQIGSLQALCWLDGSVSADSLKALKITGDKKAGRAGDFNAALTLDGDPAGGLALGSADIAGTLGGTATVHGSVGALRLGSLRADLAIDGDAKSITVNSPLAITPVEGAEIGSLHVGGTAGIKNGRESFRFSNSTMYSRETNQYSLEELRGYNVTGNSWEYLMAHSGVGDQGHCTDSVTVNAVRGGSHEAFKVTMPVGIDSATVRTGWYSDADGVHMDSWQANWDTNRVTVSFVNPPLVSPAGIMPGQKVSSSSLFIGDWTMPYNGMAVSGISSGTGKIETRRIGHEQITVPAGTFMAVKFQTSMKVSGHSEFEYKDSFYGGTFRAVETQTWWSVPGVGIIKGDVSTSVRIAARGMTFSWATSSSREMTAHA